MRLKRATHLVLMLLLATGLGVCANAAGASQTTAKKKPSSHHGTSKKTSSGKPAAAAKPTTTGTTGTPSAKSRSTKSSRRSKVATSSRKKGQKAPTSDRITEIQQALAKNGSFEGEPNGKWDTSTVDGMKKFQESHGLNPSGKLDAKTLQQLGLGSQTAGVAPPMPPVSSSSTKNSAIAEAARRQ